MEGHRMVRAVAAEATVNKGTGAKVAMAKTSGAPTSHSDKIHDRGRTGAREL